MCECAYVCACAHACVYMRALGLVLQAPGQTRPPLVQPPGLTCKVSLLSSGQGSNGYGYSHGHSHGQGSDAAASHSTTGQGAAVPVHGAPHSWHNSYHQYYSTWSICLFVKAWLRQHKVHCAVAPMCTWVSTQRTLRRRMRVGKKRIRCGLIPFQGAPPCPTY